MAIKSTNLVRLERRAEDGNALIYEFHTVVGGKVRYIKTYEMCRGHLGHISPIRRCSKDFGNKEYKALKAEGFKYAGRYEMDILGVYTKKELKGETE